MRFSIFLLLICLASISKSERVEYEPDANPQAQIPAHIIDKNYNKLPFKKKIGGDIHTNFVLDHFKFEEYDEEMKVVDREELGRNYLTVGITPKNDMVNSIFF